MRATQSDEHSLKKGTADLLVLAQLENHDRHGYEISLRIEERSGGLVAFNVASLYPILYRLEKRGLISGRWVEKQGQRRRRYYRLTAAGQKVLLTERDNWKAFTAAIGKASRAEYA